MKWRLYPSFSGHKLNSDLFSETLTIEGGVLSSLTCLRDATKIAFIFLFNIATISFLQAKRTVAFSQTMQIHEPSINYIYRIGDICYH